MANIMLVGNYGAGNVGDEILMLGSLNRINEVYPDSFVTVVTADDEESMETLGLLDNYPGIILAPRLPTGIRSLLRFRWIGTFRQIYRSEIIIFGGGGLFDIRKRFSFLIWFQYIFFGRLFGKKIVFWGQSVSSPNGNFDKFLLNLVFPGAHFKSVRDNDSLDVLSNLGIQDVVLEEDMASWFLGDYRFVQESASSLIISVRGGTLWEDNDFGNEFVSFIKKFIGVRDDLNEIILIPFQIGAGGQDDLHICSFLKSKLDAVNVTIGTNKVGDILDYYARTKLVIGCRLHSVILAKLLGVDFRVLAYHDKVLGYLKDDSDKVFELSLCGIKELFESL